jgi:hypothetical protein
VETLDVLALNASADVNARAVTNAIFTAATWSLRCPVSSLRSCLSGL